MAMILVEGLEKLVDGSFAFFHCLMEYASLLNLHGVITQSLNVNKGHLKAAKLIDNFQILPRRAFAVVESFDDIFDKVDTGNEVAGGEAECGSHDLVISPKLGSGLERASFQCKIICLIRPFTLLTLGSSKANCLMPKMSQPQICLA
jgi:hypothetical protein